MKQKFLRLLVLSLIMTFFAFSCKKETTKPETSTISPTGITLSQATLTMNKGGTYSLTATVVPSNATNKNVSWSSSNTSIATVSSSGVVTGVAVGNANIIATTDVGNYTATCAVTVSPLVVAPTGVTLSQTTLSMNTGGTFTLTATIVPSTATDQNVSWSSSNNSIVTVSSTGLLKAVAIGSATITVTTTTGNFTATCAVTVSDVSIPVTGITLSQTTLSMNIGGTYNLTATITPANATDQNVIWSSSNASIVTVSSTGVVTAVALGSATITVTTTSGNKTATCAVNVLISSIPVSGVTLSQASLSMNIGDTYNLTATVTPSNATDKSVSWSSSNNSIATVSSTGLISAVAEGNATITVTTTSGIKTATCAVTVTKPTIQVTGVSLSQTTLSMTAGDTYTLNATVTPSNASDKSVSWSSSNTSVATVNSAGVVSAVAAGNATITVTTNSGNKTATCAVTVSPPPIVVTGVALSPTSLSLKPGDMYTLMATITPSNASNKSVSWSSSNTSVATVSSTGLVTAIAAGNATITVTTVSGNKTATCAITVIPVYSVTFYNPVYTNIHITVAGITQIITPGSSVTYSGITSSSVTFSAYTSGATPTGVQIGKLISWGETLTLTTTSTTVNLNIPSTYFFIFVTNNGSQLLTQFYVNYGLVAQTYDNIQFPNNGVKYSTGYYNAYTNSNARAYWSDLSHYAYWDPIVLPWTVNQSISLTNGSGVTLKSMQANEKLNINPNKNAINLFSK
jgi:uncharacterized protein YjdB